VSDYHRSRRFQAVPTLGVLPEVLVTPADSNKTLAMPGCKHTVEAPSLSRPSHERGAGKVDAIPGRVLLSVHGGSRTLQQAHPAQHVRDLGCRSGRRPRRDRGAIAAHPTERVEQFRDDCSVVLGDPGGHRGQIQQPGLLPTPVVGRDRCPLGEVPP
jgi:hypothetical protein